MTSGVQLFQMPILSPYKIVAVNSKQQFNLMVAYGDFNVKICFYTVFNVHAFDDEQFY